MSCTSVQVTSSHVQVTSSHVQVTSSHVQVTSSHVQATVSGVQVTASHSVWLQVSCLITFPSLLQVFNLVVFELQKKLNPPTLNVDFLVQIELWCSKQDSCDWLRQSEGGAFVHVSSYLQKESTATNRKSSSSFLHLGHFLFPLLHMFRYFVFSFFSLSFLRHLLLLL